MRSRSESGSKSGQLKNKHTADWTSSIRALPSSVETNDVLKPDYIEVNLNNSRQVISKLREVAQKSSENIELMNEVNERLIILKSIQAKLEWLDE